MDTSVWWSSDLFSAMRTTLGADRSREHMEAHAKGDTVTHHRLRAEQVVEWATRGGAAVLGRSDLGSLEPGKKADVVLIKNDASPVSFPMLNPYGQIAFQAQRGDVHTVLVDGRIVKHEGKLVGVDLPDVRRRIDSTVDHLRSTLGEEAWARRHEPRPSLDDELFENPYQYTDYGADTTPSELTAARASEGGADGRSRIGPDFVESLARGLDVLACFGPHHRTMTLSEVAVAADLARPTARRLLLTLEELGFVTSTGGAFALTPKVLSLGVAYVGGLGLWDIARPHMEQLVTEDRRVLVDGPARRLRHRLRRPGLGAEDHRARASRSARGSPRRRPPRARCSSRRCSAEELEQTLAVPSRAGLPRYIGRRGDQLHDELVEVRARGWALADEELAPGVRSVAVPVRDRTGAVRAAMNVTVHAAETTTEHLLEHHLPLLLRSAGDVSAEWALWQSRPHVELDVGAEGSG